MRVLVAGAGGFIGGHLCRRLELDGHQVRGIDIKPQSDWWQWRCGLGEMVSRDLRVWEAARWAVSSFRPDWVVNLAANMGGLGYIAFNGGTCALNCAIGANLVRAAAEYGCGYFFASSACVYPPWVDTFEEERAHPGDPSEGGYGWEKLFGEKMAMEVGEQLGIPISIARFHNVYGPFGSWQGGREKAPAAMCRKALDYKRHGETFEVWGDGKQVRTFLYVDGAVEGILALLGRPGVGPTNVGSEREVTIDELATIACDLAGVSPEFKYVHGPTGVARRSCDAAKLRGFGWGEEVSLEDGMRRTYEWMEALR